MLAANLRAWLAVLTNRASTALVITALSITLSGCAAWQQDQSAWFGQDKFAHFFASAALTGATADTLDNHGPLPDCRAGRQAIAITMTIGAGKEFWDASQGRLFSPRDMLANLAGSITGALLTTECGR